ncbi:uncharacterized protein LOC100894103 [Strongylocentrotus purpuratus]|uniref:PWWP domain-containing protein n=1 Tax=Strongylocentrotus purpuratus TaxID=7668 RepID=A0A7M7N7S8_STRPU|nr:uncharacterized protein LOC100894103 [Strongylocentrotus purpuratus]XP_030832421.1 uncharacterized protein LOC100894103 [Strongylocentrotus purpuratus]
MEDTAISNCNFDNDSPLYVGQGPMTAELDDEDVGSSTAVDAQVLSEDDDGCNMQEHSEFGQDGEPEASCPNTNLVSSENQSGDHPSVDPHQNMESCQAFKDDFPDTGNADSLDWTRDSGCTKVDEYSDDDDDEIRVGHEGENTESSLRNKALKCQSTGDCELSSLVDSSKVECSSPGTAEARNVDNRSSTAKVTQSKHLSRCETLSGDDLCRTCDEDAIKHNKLEDLSFLDIRNCETPNGQEHQRPSESELPTTSNFSKDETGESQTNDTVKLCPAIESYSLRTRKRRSSFQEASPKSKPKTPSKKSAIACSKDPKITCKEGRKGKEEITPAVPRRTSPRKRNRIDHDLGEDQPKSNTIFSVCDENLNSKMVDEKVRKDSLQGKERRSVLKIESCCIKSLDKNSVLDVDDDDDDCETVSSQIFTGAPMFSGSKTGSKTRKQSLRGKGSASCQTLEDASGAGEGMQLNVKDALKERVESTIPEPDLDHEGEKRISNEDQTSNSNLKQACVEETSPCHDVLKISNRQRRSQEQSEITVISNEHMDTDHQKEEKTLKRTQKGSKICEQSKKLKCLGNKIDVMDDQNNPSSNAPVEIPLQTVHEVRNGGSCTANKEAPENIENIDGPTPPEKRTIRKARRGRPRARKSASALIDILTAASASALKRVSDSAASQPSSKENQESIQTDQTVASKKKRASSRKGRVPKARQSRKRKIPGGSPGGDKSLKSGKSSSCGRQADEPSNLTADSSPGQNAAMLRLECVSHDEGSGDDDDELMNPVLTPDSKTKDLPPAFNVGEVVWAQDSKDKSRWPAVVIEVAGENVSRRVYNVFKTNQTKEQYFQVKSSRYLKQYNCREKETYLEKGKHVTEFNTAVERANDFIMKNGLGKVNSYEDFFKPNDAYFDSPPPSPHSTSPPSPPLVVGYSSPEYPSHGPKINQPVIDDDDDEDEDEEEDESLNDSRSSVKNSCNGNSKEITRLKRKWQRKEKRLLEHMRSEQTKEYLFGIQHGTVASVRHQWFLSSNANDKGRLKWGSCGALISENKRMAIMDYLKNLLTSDESPLSSTRYMMDVALPEALNFAYQKVCRVSKDEAERVIPMDGQQVIRDLDIG